MYGSCCEGSFFFIMFLVWHVCVHDSEVVNQVYLLCVRATNTRGRIRYAHFIAGVALLKNMCFVRHHKMNVFFFRICAADVIKILYKGEHLTGFMIRMRRRGGTESAGAETIK